MLPHWAVQQTVGAVQCHKHGGSKGSGGRGGGEADHLDQRGAYLQSQDSVPQALHASVVGVYVLTTFRGTGGGKNTRGCLGVPDTQVTEGCCIQRPGLCTI